MTRWMLSSLLRERRQDREPVSFRGVDAIAMAQLAAQAKGLAARVRSAGWKRAALLSRDSYNFALGLFGLMHGGCEVVLPANHQPGTLEAMRGNFDQLIDDDGLRDVSGQEGDLEPLDASACGLTFFTSGSTGAPKRVAKTLAMFERETQALQTLWNDGGQSTVFATVPHQHVYGLTYKIMWPLAAGRPFRAETDEIWEALLAALTPQAVIVSSPAHLARMAGLKPLAPGRRPLRIFSAGAPLTLEAAIDAERVLGVRPTDIFGSTETGTIATRQQRSTDEPWQLLPGLAMHCGEAGRLRLLSPHVGEEWVETDDLVAPAAGGFHWLGRADRVVKIEGRRVSLNALEDALTNLPWVESAAVIGLPGHHRRLAAAVVLSGEGRARLTATGRFRFGRLLRAALADGLEPASTPRVWRFVDRLPSAELGKRRDSDILKLFEDAR
jgi:acyl-coenzyme A synthetase/AMP-(fatty) acid ligase